MTNTTLTQATAASFASNKAIPAVTVYAKADMLYVHDGSRFLTLGQVGNVGSVQVQASYPAGYFPKVVDTGWMANTTSVAGEMARRINACPALERRIAELEQANAALSMQLALNKAAK